MARGYVADNLYYLPPRRAEVLSSQWRLVLAAHPRRRAAFIVNTSDTTVCLAFGDRPDASVAVPAGQERGAVIFANGGVFNMTDDNLTRQAIYGRHGGMGEKNLAVQEAIPLEGEE